MEHGGKCHVATFGCRVNQADSEGILETLRERNLEPTQTHTDADVVVINSCTVTHRSDADIRKLVNRVHRENPAARVVVAGCYAQREPEALVQLAEARGTPVIISSCYESAVGRAALVRFAAAVAPDATHGLGTGPAFAADFEGWLRTDSEHLIASDGALPKEAEWVTC